MNDCFATPVWVLTIVVVVAVTLLILSLFSFFFRMRSYRLEKERHEIWLKLHQPKGEPS